MALSSCGKFLSGNDYLQDGFHHNNELQHRAVHRRVVEGLDRRQLLAEVHDGLGAFPEKVAEVHCFEKLADGFQEGAPHRMFLIHCPGRKPVLLVFKRPARPYKAPYKTDLHRKALRALKEEGA